MTRNRYKGRDAKDLENHREEAGVALTGTFPTPAYFFRNCHVSEAINNRGFFVVW